MNLYLAHNFEAGPRLLETVVPILNKEGHSVTSTWILNREAQIKNPRKISAEVDLNDIKRADGLILFSDDEPKRGLGKYIEFGYGLALQKLTIVVGKDDSIFFTKSDYHFEEWCEAVLKTLERYK